MLPIAGDQYQIEQRGTVQLRQRLVCVDLCQQPCPGAFNLLKMLHTEHMTKIGRSVDEYPAQTRFAYQLGQLTWRNQNIITPVFSFDDMDVVLFQLADTEKDVTSSH